MGLIVCPWIETYGVPQWPTQEMLGRGELRSLWVGVLVAVPSGAGVALSVLGGNAGAYFVIFKSYTPRKLFCTKMIMQCLKILHLSLLLC